MKTTIKLETLPKAKLKIIYVDKFKVDAIFIYKNEKLLLTWYSDYFIECDSSYIINDKIFKILIDEMMDICANYQCYIMNGWNIPPLLLIKEYQNKLCIKLGDFSLKFLQNHIIRNSIILNVHLLWYEEE